MEWHQGQKQTSRTAKKSVYFPRYFLANFFNEYLRQKIIFGVTKKKTADKKRIFSATYNIYQS